jgi:hypothetical protein
MKTERSPPLASWRHAQTPRANLEEISNGYVFSARTAEPQMIVELISRPVLGGLHHDYHWQLHERPSYLRAARRIGVFGQDRRVNRSSAFIMLDPLPLQTAQQIEERLDVHDGKLKLGDQANNPCD